MLGKDRWRNGIHGWRIFLRFDSRRFMNSSMRVRDEQFNRPSFIAPFAIKIPQLFISQSLPNREFTDFGSIYRIVRLILVRNLQLRGSDTMS